MFIVAVLWTAFFAVNFNIAMMIPLLPFIQRDIGLSPTQAGFVLAAFPVVALISNLALGPLIDRFGRKRFIIIGASACAMTFLLTAVSHTASLIALARAATGIFMPMIGASVFAAIADYIPAGDRARVAGYVTSSAPVAFLLSMSGGIFLGGLFSWQLPLILFAVLLLCLAAAAWFLPPTRTAELSQAPLSLATYRARLLSMSVNSNTRRLLAAYFCWSAAVFTFLGLYPSWLLQQGLAQQGPPAIATMLFLGEVGGLFGALLSGRIAGLFRWPFAAITIAVAITAVVIALIPAGTGAIAAQAICYVVFAFGRDLTLALILGSAMMLIAASERGSLNAVLNAVYQSGATLGGMASAWLYGFRPDFIANAGLAALLLVASALLLWGLAKPAEPASA